MKVCNAGSGGWAAAAVAGVLFAVVLVLAGCGGGGGATAGSEGGQAAAGDVVNVYIWSAYLPQGVVDRFTAKTGIKVNVDLYDSNEALLEKLQSGVADYDFVVPSDYMVKILIAEDLVQPLDHARLPHLANLDPRFLDRKFDPGNRFSVPYVWGTTGLGYRKGTVDGPAVSWQVLFDPAHRGRILMLDDVRECFAVALKSMGRSLNETDPAVLAQAAELLKRQKPLVKTYNSGDFANILAAGDVDLAHGYNGQLAQVVREHPGELAYAVPEEGGTLWIDSVCIPAGARHAAAAHAFLDFVLAPESAAEIVNEMGYASANVPARALIRPEILNDPAIYPPDEVLARCELIEDVGEATTLYDRLWTEIKAQ